VKLGEYALRIGGGVVCAALGALTAVYEAFYSNFYQGLPAVAVAFLCGFGLTHFAWFTVGTRWAPVLAIVPWLIVMVAAASQRTEGDGVILGNSCGGALGAVVGMVGFAAPYFRTVRRPRPPALPPPAAPAPQIPQI
jgi:hypothetical protein